MLKNEEIAALCCYGSTAQMLIRDGCLLINYFLFHRTRTRIQDTHFFDQSSSVAYLSFVSIYLSNLERSLSEHVGEERAKERTREGERAGE